ncbi:hypothetical protein ES705_40948 [subsurface metagenome]
MIRQLSAAAANRSQQIVLKITCFIVRQDQGEIFRRRGRYRHISKQFLNTLGFRVHGFEIPVGILQMIEWIHHCFVQEDIGRHIRPFAHGRSRFKRAPRCRKGYKDHQYHDQTAGKQFPWPSEQPLQW